jgi:uncharacterized membrane protein
VFESENAARQGVQALRKLDEEGRIELYELAAIRKNADGTITRLREDQDFPAPSRTLAGAALGSLLGLLGGGVGFAVGAGIGALIGFIHDVHTASVDTEFLSDVSSALTPGKFAVAADVREDWVIPLDRMMEAQNGLVIRGPKFGDDERRVRESSARRTEIEQLESEHESADEDGKGRLRRKIEELRVRLERRLEVDHLWRERILEEMRVRAQGLKSPAAKS